MWMMDWGFVRKPNWKEEEIYRPKSCPVPVVEIEEKKSPPAEALE